MRKAVIGIAALGLVAGCASGPPCPAAQAGQPPEHIAVRIPGYFDEAAVQCGRIYSPSIDVTRYDNDYRGQSNREQVDLRVTPDKILGMVGSGRTDLHIVRHPDGFELQGLYAGKMSALTYRGGRIDGQLGGRVFHLAKNASKPGEAAPTTAAETAPAGNAGFPAGNTSTPQATESSSTATGQSAPGGLAKGGATGMTQIELPPSFHTLPPEHQGALLAIFLGR
jgi:hypothetical protein